MTQPCENSCERTMLPLQGNGHTLQCNLSFIGEVAQKIRDRREETNES